MGRLFVSARLVGSTWLCGYQDRNTSKDTCDGVQLLEGWD